MAPPKFAQNFHIHVDSCRPHFTSAQNFVFHGDRESEGKKTHRSCKELLFNASLTYISRVVSSLSTLDGCGNDLSLFHSGLGFPAISHLAFCRLLRRFSGHFRTHSFFPRIDTFEYSRNLSFPLEIARKTPSPKVQGRRLLFPDTRG